MVRRVYARSHQSRAGLYQRYGVDSCLVRIYDDAITAIAREKELKKWRCDWKIRLIEEEHPGCTDLYPSIAS